MSQEIPNNLFAGRNPVTGGTPALPPSPEEPMWEALIGKINSIEDKELPEFLSFNVLNEIIDKPSSKVGDFERTFFKEAFTALIEQDFQIDNFESCWRAY